MKTTNTNMDENYATPSIQYDNTDPLSIESYAKRLIGQTFMDVLSNNKKSEGFIGEEALAFGNANRKGGLGNLLEIYYFGIKANSYQEADFKQAGVELKVTPYEVKRNGELRAGERVAITMISFDSPIEDHFYNSHVWEKIKLILFIFYLRNRRLDNNLLYPIHYVKLYTPSQSDLLIIQNDYQFIIAKIKEGKAHELSESDTLYLGASTKGSTAERSTVPQFYSPHTPARKRAFCYKTPYVTYILNTYITHDITTYEPIIKDIAKLKSSTFYEYVYGLINSHIGQSDKELCQIYGREYNNNKTQWIDLSFRMLGIKSNRAEEFQKANIVVKAIRIESNGKIKENISFPTFKYKELAQETWEYSTLHNYFDETKFLFVVFQKIGSEYILQGGKFWNMPYNHLNETVKQGWEAIQQTIIQGIKLTLIHSTNGVIIKNNFPKKGDNKIIHVRPHATKRYYRLEDGSIIGNGRKSHANELPDGRWMTNYSFWINNDYILSQLDINHKA